MPAAWADRRQRMGLGARVAAVSLALLAAWFIAYSTLIAPRIRASFQREQEARIELLSRAIGSELNHLLAGARREIEGLAALPVLASMDPEQLAPLLAHQDATTPTFLHFFVLDAEGTVISRPSKPERRGADRSARSYFRRVRDEGRTVVDDLRRSTAGNRSLIIATPIRGDDGRFAGVLAGSLGLMDRNEHLYALITEPTRTRWPVDIFLLSGGGEVLASSQPQDRADRQPATLGVGATPAGAAHLGNEATFVADGKKRWIVSSFAVEDVDWRLMLRVPASVIDQHAGSITRTITIASLALFVAALAVGLALSSWLVRPLNRLSTRLMTYGREGAAPPIPVTGPRELQDAANAFNAMIAERERALTERDALEQQLRQSQKLQMVGTLASGIAHDFNNLLTPIVFGATLLERKLPQGSDLHATVQNIGESATRATELVERILTFSRSSAQSTRRSPVSLAHVVNEAMRLAKVSVPATTTLETEIEEDASAVLADAAQLHQVLLNLCKNAADAIAGRAGTITVRLRRRGAELELSVRDTGGGMDEETRTRVFEPFFTTKPSGKGTGLGLSVVHGIVTDHGGRIEIDSEPGQGTCVRIVLPRLESTAATGAQQATDGAARVLLVDDEAPILHATAGALTDLGYEVETEQDSERALARIVEDGDAFDVVICDNNMPNLTGCQLIERAVDARGSLPFLVITGVAGQDLRDRCAELGVVEVLEKPLSLERLDRALRTALAEVDEPARDA